MEAFVSCLLVLPAGILAVLVFVFFLEILAATLAPSRFQQASDHGVRPHVAVVVPAHNESSGIVSVLTNIQEQLRPGDRLLVVADNCSDDTAAVANGAGAEVIERTDTMKKGKGFALDWGIRHLDSDPREIVIIVDADCRLLSGAIDELASTCATSARPSQALYLMSAPDASQVNHQVAEFSWRVKNWLRPLGLRMFNLPCQLMGTGMAFPWQLIRSADLANSHLVEDLKLGLDLARAGHAPVFCPSACVTSEFASSAKGAGSQRQRWEQGHLDMILSAAPRLLVDAIAHRNLDLLAVTLDLAVPPLSLLCMLVLGSFCLSLLAAGFGAASYALAVSSISLLAFIIATALAWFSCGRDVLPITSLVLIPSYALRKVNLYRQLVFGKTETEWNRTDRTKQ